VHSITRLTLPSRTCPDSVPMHAVSAAACRPKAPCTAVAASWQTRHTGFGALPGAAAAAGAAAASVGLVFLPMLPVEVETYGGGAVNLGD
jgi:hypothetical protein